MSNLKSIKEMLNDSENQKIYEKAAVLFVDDTIGYNEFPEEHIDFLIEILSKHYTNKGAFYFLALVGEDIDIMNQQQLKKISDTIIDNCSRPNCYRKISQIIHRMIWPFYDGFATLQL